METKTIQSTDLVRFISNISISSEGQVSINLLGEDRLEDFESALFEPTYSISALARITYGMVRSGIVVEDVIQLPSNTFTQKVLNSQLKNEALDIYTLTQSVVLEAFALVYHIREDKTGLRYMTLKDMKRVRTNLSYIGDFFGTKKEYYHLIEDVRNMNIALGYIEHQIDTIQNSKAVR